MIAFRTFLTLIAVCAALGSAATAQAASYRLPENGDNVVGAVTTLKLAYEDTLASIAEEYGVGFREIVDANPGVDPWLPGEGTIIVLPTQYVLPSTPREGIVINVAEYRMYFYPAGGNRVITFPVGVGREEYRTPLIKTQTVASIRNPSWTPTKDARREHAEYGDILPPVVPPGPENPLGELAIQLKIPGYFIHGTNKPFGVGQKVSHGCIRLHNEHVLTLAELAPSGTPVYIVNEPVKVGVRYDEVFLEIHRDLYEEPDQESLKHVVLEKSGDHAANLDWQRVAQVLDDLKGIPVRI
ncbi:MAG: L,D-transpeptidase family protein [Pseudomonadales bacterium]